jgi:prepilin-type processing-associated H-X9-DG protein
VISPYNPINSTYPYVKNWELAASPGTPQVSGGAVSNAAPGGASKITDVSYTFNGLLASFSHTAVAQVAQLPVIWNGRGKAKVKGGSISNPALICNTANAGCSYIPRDTINNTCVTGNGGTSAMFVLSGTMWVYAKGANFGLADGHAKWRRMGAQLTPQNTDWRVDPYTGYNSAGFPGFFWYDLCHAWLFRPDYEFNI